jgi:uncharacterized membrane protein YsdA (DUF1294 family)/cold shock CspA family protein
MRCKGRVAEWNDDRGFGFVYPVVGGDRVFVHIKAFSNRDRRPVNGDIVVYDLTRDAKGRPQGINVAIAGVRTIPRVNVGPGRAPLAFAALFLLAVTAAVAVRKIPPLVLTLYVVVSVITYAAYALDKSAARNDRRRTSEATLHFLSLLGGWPGALLAQRTLRHKSKKQSFRCVFWGTVAMNCCAFAWILLNADGRVGDTVGVV